MKDYYKILGIAKSASVEEVKKAYRRLAHQYHPDKPGGSELKFKEINEAYQVLSNKDKKAQYDRFGRTFDPGSGFSGGMPGFDFGNFDFSAGGGPTAGWEFGFGGEEVGDLSDVFDAFFEGLGVKRRKTYRRGSDIEIIQELTLEEAFIGVKKTVKYQTFVKCSVCGGAGYDQKSGASACGVCGGQGKVRENRSTFFGNFSQVRTCAQCSGNGEIPNKICSVCSGHGRQSAEQKIEIAIKPGVEDRQVITVKGAGETGERGSSAGDLYIVVKIQPHSFWKRQGADLIIFQDLKLTEAFLSKIFKIKHLDGNIISFEIPAGFNLKKPLRVPGLGMPRFEGGRGDLYIEFNLKVPKPLSPKAKKLLEELDKEL